MTDDAVRRLRQLGLDGGAVTRADVVAAVLVLAARLEDLAFDLDDVDRRARPYGDGTDIDSYRRQWHRGKGRR